MPRASILAALVVGAAALMLAPAASLAQQTPAKKPASRHSRQGREGLPREDAVQRRGQELGVQERRSRAASGTRSTTSSAAALLRGACRRFGVELVAPGATIFLGASSSGRLRGQTHGSDPLVCSVQWCLQRLECGKRGPRELTEPSAHPPIRDRMHPPISFLSELLTPPTLLRSPRSVNRYSIRAVRPDAMNILGSTA